MMENPIKKFITEHDMVKKMTLTPFEEILQENSDFFKEHIIRLEVEKELEKAIAVISGHEMSIKHLEAKLEAAETFGRQAIREKFLVEMQRDEARQQSKEWEEKYKESCVKRSDNIEQVLSLQEQFASLRGVLEETQESIALAIEMSSDIKEKFFDYEITENTTDTGGKGRMMDIEAHLMGTNIAIDEALTATPSTKYERIENLAHDAIDLLRSECEECKHYISSTDACDRGIGECDVLMIAQALESVMGEGE